MGATPRRATNRARPLRGAYPPLTLQPTVRLGERDERCRHVLAKDLLCARAVASDRMSCICSSLPNASLDQLAEPLNVRWSALELPHAPVIVIHFAVVVAH